MLPCDSVFSITLVVCACQRIAVTHLKVVLRQTIYKKFGVYMTVNMLILGKHVCSGPWSVEWWFACSFVVGGVGCLWGKA